MAEVIAGEPAFPQGNEWSKYSAYSLNSLKSGNFPELRESRHRYAASYQSPYAMAPKKIDVNRIHSSYDKLHGAGSHSRMTESEFRVLQMHPKLETSDLNKLLDIARIYDVSAKRQRIMHELELTKRKERMLEREISHEQLARNKTQKKAAMRLLDESVSGDLHKLKTRLAAAKAELTAIRADIGTVTSPVRRPAQPQPQPAAHRPTAAPAAAMAKAKQLPPVTTKLVRQPMPPPRAPLYASRQPPPASRQQVVRKTAPGTAPGGPPRAPVAGGARPAAVVRQPPPHAAKAGQTDYRARRTAGPAGATTTLPAVKTGPAPGTSGATRPVRLTYQSGPNATHQQQRRAAATQPAPRPPPAAASRRPPGADSMSAAQGQKLPRIGEASGATSRPPREADRSRQTTTTTGEVAARARTSSRVPLPPDVDTQYTINKFVGQRESEVSAAMSEPYSLGRLDRLVAQVLKEVVQRQPDGTTEVVDVDKLHQASPGQTHDQLQNAWIEFPSKTDEFQHLKKDVSFGAFDEGAKYWQSQQPTPVAPVASNLKGKVTEGVKQSSVITTTAPVEAKPDRPQIITSAPAAEAVKAVKAAKARSTTPATVPAMSTKATATEPASKTKEVLAAETSKLMADFRNSLKETTGRRVPEPTVAKSANVQQVIVTPQVGLHIEKAPNSKQKTGGSEKEAKPKDVPSVQVTIQSQAVEKIEDSAGKNIGMKAGHGSVQDHGGKKIEHTVPKKHTITEVRDHVRGNMLEQKTENSLQKDKTLPAVHDEAPRRTQKKIDDGKREESGARKPRSNEKEVFSKIDQHTLSSGDDETRMSDHRMTSSTELPLSSLSEKDAELETLMSPSETKKGVTSKTTPLTPHTYNATLAAAAVRDEKPDTSKHDQYSRPRADTVKVIDKGNDTKIVVGKTEQAGPYEEEEIRGDESQVSAASSKSTDEVSIPPMDDTDTESQADDEGPIRPPSGLGNFSDDKCKRDDEELQQLRAGAGLDSGRERICEVEPTTKATGQKYKDTAAFVEAGAPVKKSEPSPRKESKNVELEQQRAAATKQDTHQKLTPYLQSEKEAKAVDQKMTANTVVRNTAQKSQQVGENVTSQKKNRTQLDDVVAADDEGSIPDEGMSQEVIDRLLSNVTVLSASEKQARDAAFEDDDFISAVITGKASYLEREYGLPSLGSRDQMEEMVESLRGEGPPLYQADDAGVLTYPLNDEGMPDFQEGQDLGVADEDFHITGEEDATAELADYSIEDGDYGQLSEAEQAYATGRRNPVTAAEQDATTQMFGTKKPEPMDDEVSVLPEAAQSEDWDDTLYDLYTPASAVDDDLSSPVNVPIPGNLPVSQTEVLEDVFPASEATSPRNADHLLDTI